MAERVWLNFQGPNFTMKAPSDWFITATPEIQTMFLEPGRGQRIRANLMITIRPVQADVTVQGVLENAQATQQQQFPQFELLGSDDVQAGDVVGKYQLYTWFNPDENVPVIQAQAFFIARQLLISMTATADREREDEITPIFNEMFGSFKIANPT